jgi:hypothetical protein
MFCILYFAGSVHMPILPMYGRFHRTCKRLLILNHVSGTENCTGSCQGCRTEVGHATVCVGPEQ